VQDGRLVWTKGLGHADMAGRRPAAPDTVYHLASLTKPFAAVVLLQAVEAGQLDLETPVARYGIELESHGTIRVKHLFTHTSEGAPGESYRYHGARFAQLDKVVAAVTGVSFATAVSARILEPLALRDTAPNPAQPQACAEAKRDTGTFARRLAQGYDSDGLTPVAYPTYFGTAAGLVSTVEDVARFSIAVDDDRLWRAETRRRAFTPPLSTKGERLPYGLGWFVQDWNGLTLVWHYGLWTGTSTLIVKVPERRLTFIVLANSDGLSRPFGLGGGDLLRSPFAREFLQLWMAPGGLR
jgi:CubicO group peptidase (beta-lactamase class C family)